MRRPWRIAEARVNEAVPSGGAYAVLFLLSFLVASCENRGVGSAPVAVARDVSSTPALDKRPTVERADAGAVKNIIARARGKPLVVNVWATWCGPCVAEMPELIKFSEFATQHNVVFLSLSADSTDTVEDTVKPFVQSKKIPFSVHVLDGVPPDDLAAMLGAQSAKWTGALPATFLFDKNGALVKAWLEQVRADELESACASLLQ